MGLINTTIKPFKATGFKEGKFVDVSDTDLKGKWSIFFFYPADFTFVCPTELEDLADNYDTFQKMGVEIYSVARLAELVAALRIEIGMVAAPAPQAQSAVDQLVAAGVSGILNFAPVTLTVPPSVCIVGVDLARELEQVTFAIVSRLRTDAS